MQSISEEQRKVFQALMNKTQGGKSTYADIMHDLLKKAETLPRKSKTLTNKPTKKTERELS